MNVVKSRWTCRKGLDKGRMENCLRASTSHILPNTENWWHRSRGRLLVAVLPSFKINMQVLNIKLTFFAALMLTTFIA
jgi:hypothetical protein